MSGKTFWVLSAFVLAGLITAPASAQSDGDVAPWDDEAPAGPTEGPSEPPPADATDTEPAPTDTAPDPAPPVAPSDAAATSAAQPEGPQDTVLSPEEAREAEEAEGDDEHVGRHNRFRAFYAELSAGYTFVHLGLVKEDNLVSEIARIKDSGIGVGAGLGFFVSFVTLGVQAEVAFHDAFNLGTLTFDVGIRIPTPHIEPYFRVGVGYAWLFGQDLFPPGAPEPTVRGVAFDVGLGFDFMINEVFAIGIGADAALFNVRRERVSGVMVANIDISDQGNAIGVQVSTLLQFSAHF